MEANPEQKNNTNGNVTFGKKLQNYRKKIKITQKDLGAKIGVTNRTITSWENDNSYPKKQETLKALIEVLLFNGAFTQGREKTQIQSFWRSPEKGDFILDEDWLNQLVNDYTISYNNKNSSIKGQADNPSSQEEVFVEENVAVLAENFPLSANSTSSQKEAEAINNYLHSTVTEASTPITNVITVSNKALRKPTTFSVTRILRSFKFLIALTLTLILGVILLILQLLNEPPKVVPFNESPAPSSPISEAHLALANAPTLTEVEKQDNLAILQAEFSAIDIGTAPITVDFFMDGRKLLPDETDWNGEHNYFDLAKNVTVHPNGVAYNYSKQLGFLPGSYFCVPADYRNGVWSGIGNWRIDFQVDTQLDLTNVKVSQ